MALEGRVFRKSHTYTTVIIRTRCEIRFSSHFVNLGTLAVIFIVIISWNILVEMLLLLFLFYTKELWPSISFGFE